jgi:hypothetical protein
VGLGYRLSSLRPLVGVLLLCFLLPTALSRSSCRRNLDRHPRALSRTLGTRGRRVSQGAGQLEPSGPGWLQWVGGRGVLGGLGCLEKRVTLSAMIPSFFILSSLPGLRRCRN